MTQRQLKDADRRKMNARAMRYKKPIAKGLNLYDISEELVEMEEECQEIHWYDNDEESLVAALDGDEDEALAFKMAFADLESDLERFREDLTEITYDEKRVEMIDTLFPAAGEEGGGLLGWDQEEGDYFGLEPYEYSYARDEAAKRIMALTKKDILDVVGQGIRLFTSYVGVRYRYDCLSTSMDILRGENRDKIAAVKGIEEQYEKAEEASGGFRYENLETLEFDRRAREIPQEFWIM